MTLKFGAGGVHFPPPDNSTLAAKFYEESGLDFVTYGDQLSVTIPRSIWTPDIVAAADAWDVDLWMDPWPLMALAAEATSRIDIGLTAVDALRRLPANLAQMILTLDHIAEGRLFVAMGAGESKQFTPYGVPRSKPFAHLEESMRIIRKLWESNDLVDYDGPIWKLKNAILRLEPYGPRPPRLIVAGGPGRAIEIAAELGDGWCTYLPVSGTPEWYAGVTDSLRTKTEAAGRDPADFMFFGMFLCIIAETDDEIAELMEHPILKWDAAALVPSGETWQRYGMTNPLGENWSYPRDLVPMDWSREDALQVISQVSPKAVRLSKLSGTPRQVADLIQPYIDAGVTHVQVINYAPLLTSGDFGDAVAKSSLVAQTVQYLREANSAVVSS